MAILGWIVVGGMVIGLVAMVINWPAPHILVQALWEWLMNLFTRRLPRRNRGNHHVSLAFRPVLGRGLVAQ